MVQRLVRPLDFELLVLAALPGLATLATWSPAFHAWCLLDREAVAAGELWRLWTGHLAHFSLSHLLVDAVVFVLLGVALVRSGVRVIGQQGLADIGPSDGDAHPSPAPPPSPRSCLAGRGGSVAVNVWRAWSLGWVLAIGSGLLSLGLLAGDASLACYGGLSGLNSLLLGWLAVRWFRAGGQLRALGLGLLAVAVGKFGLDFSSPGASAVQLGDLGVVSSQLSHWLGLGWGLVAGWTLPSGRGSATRSNV